MTTTDGYERRFMGADEVLYRERVRMAWWGHVLHLVGLVMAMHAFLVSGAWLGLLVVPFAWLVLMTLRVAVTRREVHVQLGVFGPRIPLGDIESVESLRGGVLGLSARMTFGPVYSVPSSARDMVRIAYRKNGRRRTVRFSSRDPERMVRAIEGARAKGQARIALAPAAATPRAPYSREQAEAEAEVEEMLGTRVDPLSRRASR